MSRAEHALILLGIARTHLIRGGRLSSSEHDRLTRALGDLAALTDQLSEWPAAGGPQMLDPGVCRGCGAQQDSIYGAERLPLLTQISLTQAWVDAGYPDGVAYQMCEECLQ